MMTISLPGNSIQDASIPMQHIEITILSPLAGKYGQYMDAW